MEFLLFSKIIKINTRPTTPPPLCFLFGGLTPKFRITNYKLPEIYFTR